MDILYKELKAKLKNLNEERVSLLEKREKLQERLSGVEGAIRSIENLFNYEGITDSEIQCKTHSTKPLAEYLHEIMIDREVYSVDELIYKAKSMGYDFEEKSPYRSINFTLMGLQRSGKYQREPKGWRYVG